MAAIVFLLGAQFVGTSAAVTTAVWPPPSAAARGVQGHASQDGAEDGLGWWRSAGARWLCRGTAAGGPPCPWPLPHARVLGALPGHSAGARLGRRCARVD